LRGVRFGGKDYRTKALRWTLPGPIMASGCCWIAMAIGGYASAQVVLGPVPESQRQPRVELRADDVVAPSTPKSVWRIDWPSQGAAAREARFSADGTWIAALKGPEVIHIDASNGAMAPEAIVRHSSELVYTMALSANSRLAALGGYGHVDLYELASGRRIRRFQCAECVIGAIAFSPDGTKLAFQDRKPGIQRRRGLGSVRIADLRTGGMVEREAITGRASV